MTFSTQSAKKTFFSLLPKLFQKYQKCPKTAFHLHKMQNCKKMTKDQNVNFLARDESNPAFDAIKLFFPPKSDYRVEMCTE
jgi:hypothetical protein